MKLLSYSIAFLLITSNFALGQDVNVNNDANLIFYNGNATNARVRFFRGTNTDKADGTTIVQSLDFDMLGGGGQNCIMSIDQSSKANSLLFHSTGVAVGHQSANPGAEAPLHVKVTDSGPFEPNPVGNGIAEVVRIENATSGSATVRNLLTLKNNGGARFALQNEATGKRWVISTDNTDTLFWTEANSADPATAPFFRMFLNSTSSSILAQMGELGNGTLFNFRRNGNLVINGTLTEGSDRNAKEHVREINQEDVLKRVCKLPITTWKYKKDENSVRHMGPMAQDFHAAFGLGDSSKTISTVDRDGVALASIQALNSKVSEKDREIKDLNEKLQEQETVLQDQNQRIERLESMVQALLEK